MRDKRTAQESYVIYVYIFSKACDLLVTVRFTVRVRVIFFHCSRQSRLYPHCCKLYLHVDQIREKPISLIVSGKKSKTIFKKSVRTCILHQKKQA